jgi:hypothetical protein
MIGFRATRPATANATAIKMPMNRFTKGAFGGEGLRKLADGASHGCRAEYTLSPGRGDEIGTTS